MDQIAAAIWAFGRVFGADRHCDRRLDRSAASVTPSEPSRTCDTSGYRKKM